MKNKKMLYFMVILSVSLFALWGCPKKAAVTSLPEEQQPAAVKAEAAPTAREEPKERAATADNGLQPVYFDFDRSFIRDDAKAVMKANADWLKANPRAKVRIQGNCDERGTIEYNQALGQRRAQSAKKYLTDMGVSASRFSLISYGKEKPLCTRSSEECWQKNRRDDFVAVNE